jgi:hypothetical protein
MSGVIPESTSPVRRATLGVTQESISPVQQAMLGVIPESTSPVQQAMSGVIPESTSPVRQAMSGVIPESTSPVRQEIGGVSAVSDVNPLEKAGNSPVVKIYQSKKEAKMKTWRQKTSAWKRRIAAAWFALGVLALLAAFSTDARAQAPAVDPAAVQILKRMTDFLDGLQQFSVNTQSIIEELHVSGHRVDYDLSADVTVKRPNKLRAARTGELMNQHFFYDGKTLALYNPSQRVYATKTAPETIEKMIDFARETVGILLPAADLLYRNAFPLLMQDVTLAVVVGKTVVGGVKCDHVLFSRPGVDFQVWVAEGKQPWPLKYVVTETATASMLSITTFLSDWNLAPAVDEARFSFVPPKGSQAISFLPPDATGGSNR